MFSSFLSSYTGKITERNIVIKSKFYKIRNTPKKLEIANVFGKFKFGLGVVTEVLESFLGSSYCGNQEILNKYKLSLWLLMRTFTVGIFNAHILRRNLLNAMTQRTPRYPFKQGCTYWNKHCNVNIEQRSIHHAFSFLR